MEVAVAFDEHLRKMGWQQGQRIPRNSCVDFIEALEWSGRRKTHRLIFKQVRAWHQKWQQGGHAAVVAVATAKRGRGRLALQDAGGGYKRMRCFGGGRPRKAIWLSKTLYEWWSGARFAVDWTAVRMGCPAIAGHRKKLARFTQAMLNEKAKEIIVVYCTEKLRRGQRCEIPQLRADW